jgi:hypothetical protein
MKHLLPPDPLDPEAPGLDEDTRFRRRRLAEMEKMSPEELRALAVRAGILTPEGELTAPYLDDTPSPYREALSGNALDFPILEVLQSLTLSGPRRLDEIAAELGRQWAVSVNEVLGRLRRMVSHGLVDEVQSHCFAVTDAGRKAEPVG